MSCSRKVVGIASAPDWFDPAPDEFRALTKGDVGVQQTFFDPPNFDYKTESIAECEPQLTRAAQHLANAGSTIVASPATPFGYLGHRDISQARAQMKRVEQACGVPCISSITAIFDALDAWQLRKVALACTYYPDDWRDLWSEFVSNSGFDVLCAASLVNQGIKSPPETEIVEYPTAAEIREAVEMMAGDFPDAEAIVITGSGARTMAVTPELQAVTGKRIIAADTGLFRALCEKLEIDFPLPL